MPSSLAEFNKNACLSSFFLPHSSDLYVWGWEVHIVPCVWELNWLNAALPLLRFHANHLQDAGFELYLACSQPWNTKTLLKQNRVCHGTPGCAVNTLRVDLVQVWSHKGLNFTMLFQVQYKIQWVSKQIQNIDFTVQWITLSLCFVWNSNGFRVLQCMHLSVFHFIII